MKRRFLTAVAVVMFSLAPVAAYAQLPGMDMDSQVKEYISQALPPYVGVVDFEPANPAADEEVTVTASIGMIQLAEEETAEVAAAVLYYTADGGESWEEVDMEQQDNPELWSAAIPGQPEGTEVEFYVKAVSDSGDISVDMQGREVILDFGQSQNVELAPAMNLKGYDPSADGDSPFEHLALIAEDADDPNDQAVPEADIQQMRFGYDDEYYYLRLKFENKIDGGKLTPLLARIYLGFILNLRRDFKDFDARETKMSKFVDQVKSIFPIDNQQAMAEEGAKRIFAWFWAPLTDAIPPLPGIGKIPREALIKLNPSNIKAPVFDTTSVDSDIRDDGTVDLKMKKSALGYEDTDMLMFLFFDLEITGTNVMDFKSLQVKFPDIAFPTILKMAGHKYTVGS